MVVKCWDWTCTSRVAIFNLPWTTASALRISWTGGPLTVKRHMNTYWQFFIQLILLHFKSIANTDHIMPVCKDICMSYFGFCSKLCYTQGKKSKVCNKLYFLTSRHQSSGDWWLWSPWQRNTVLRGNPLLSHIILQGKLGKQVLEGSSPNSQGRIMLTELNECFPKQWHFILVYVYKGKDMVSEIGRYEGKFWIFRGKKSYQTYSASTT